MSVWDGFAHSGGTIRVKAQFPNVSGGFDSGLSPTVDIMKDSDGSLLVDGATMTAFPNMPEVYYYDYTTSADGILTVKADSGDGRTAIAYWLIGSGSLPDTVVSSGSIDDIADSVWDEILTGATHNIPTSAGRRLRQIASQVVWDGIAQGAGTDNNQIRLDTDASSVDGAYDPALIAIIAGTGAGQCRLILQYEGSTRMATVDRGWKVQPDDTSEFIIYADPGREHVNEGLAQAGGPDTITLNASASSLDDNYINQLVFIRSGTGEDQVRRVTDYNGTTKVATVSPAWGTQPDTTSAYVMLAATLPDLSAFALESSVQSAITLIGNIPDDVWIYDEGRTITGYEYDEENPAPPVYVPPEFATDCRLVLSAAIQSSTPPTELENAICKIIHLPLIVDGRFYTKQEIEITFSSEDGSGYWDVVRGARVKLMIPDLGVWEELVVPDQEIYDISYVFAEA